VGFRKEIVKSNSITEFESRPELSEIPNAVREALSNEMARALKTIVVEGLFVCSKVRMAELVQQCLIRAVARRAGKFAMVVDTDAGEVVTEIPSAPKRHFSGHGLFAKGGDLLLTTEDGSAGERGRVVAPLDRQLASRPASSPVMVYACGPEGMLAATARASVSHGRPCQVSVERVMSCGLGGCYSCVIPMRGEHGGFHHVRSCIAGPVLAADQIVWD